MSFSQLNPIAASETIASTIVSVIPDQSSVKSYANADLRAESEWQKVMDIFRPDQAHRFLQTVTPVYVRRLFDLNCVNDIFGLCSLSFVASPTIWTAPNICDNPAISFSAPPLIVPPPPALPSLFSDFVLDPDHHESSVAESSLVDQSASSVHSTIAVKSATSILHRPSVISQWKQQMSSGVTSSNRIASFVESSWPVVLGLKQYLGKSGKTNIDDVHLFNPHVQAALVENSDFFAPKRENTESAPVHSFHRPEMEKKKKKKFKPDSIASASALPSFSTSEPMIDSSFLGLKPKSEKKKEKLKQIFKGRPPPANSRAEYRFVSASEKKVRLSFKWIPIDPGSDDEEDTPLAVLPSALTSSESQPIKRQKLFKSGS
jgi:hypothetical protein